MKIEGHEAWKDFTPARSGIISRITKRASCDNAGYIDIFFDTSTEIALIIASSFSLSARRPVRGADSAFVKISEESVFLHTSRKHSQQLDGLCKLEMGQLQPRWVGPKKRVNKNC